MKKFLDPRKQNFRLKNDYLTTNYFFDINKWGIDYTFQ